MARIENLEVLEPMYQDTVSVNQLFDILKTGIHPARRRSLRKPRSYPESDLQRNIISELCIRYPRIRALTTATGAGGKRNVREAARMKAEGLTAGYPDLAIYIPAKTNCGLFVELKAPGGRPTVIQKEKMAQLEEKGYYVAVVDSRDGFFRVLQDYFGIPLENVR
jgi:hypothetical protein